MEIDYFSGGVVKNNAGEVIDKRKHREDDHM
jgi:hypothetical protein